MFKMMLLSAIAAAGTAAFNGIKAVAARSVKRGTMIRDTHAARVEPITIIDANVANYERIDDLCHFSLNTFTAIYLQSIALAGTTVGNVEVQKRLARHNPNMASPVLESGDQPNDPVVRAILEDDAPLYEHGLPSAADYASLESAKTGAERPSGSNVQKATEVLRDANALSVGKVLNIELREQNETINVPVTVRLASVIANTEVLTHALKARFKSGETALERKMGWKSGRLTLIRDILFCRDLVREHYKQLLKDHDGIYAKLNPDRAKDYLRSALSGDVNVARASNILMIDEETARQVEATLGGKLSQANFRQRLLEATGIMILVVVSPEDDIVTFYLETVADGTQISGRNLNKAASNDGPDINQLLTSLVAGSGRARLV